MKLKIFRNKFFYLVVGSLWASTLSAQKVVSKVFSLPPNTRLELAFPWADQITYHGKEEQETLQIIYKTSGEYQNKTFLSEQQKGATLLLKEAYVPLAQTPNDKLSAHKNIVSNVTLYAPSAVQVSIQAKEAQVNILGKLSELALFLEDGLCLWEASLNKGKIETQDARVEVRTPAIAVSGTSQNGLVRIRPLTNRPVQLEVHSINGAILQP